MHLKALLTLGTAAAAGLFGFSLSPWSGGSTANAASAVTEITLDARLGQSKIVPGKTDKIYLRVNLAGAALESIERRTPVNVAIVIDRSGSMQGDGKMARAREAAIMAINRLARDDIASVVAYNQGVDVLVPATRVDAHNEITGIIERLQAAGQTALYAGTVEGIRQVRKFRAGDRVNRVILLSDGLANVGPSSPEELAKLGRDTARDGISITTIGLGLGYNEDLMSKLAYNSDGNHAFVKDADDLIKVFNSEFGDVLSVVAQEVEIIIRCRSGFKPVRVLGREAKVSGNEIRVGMNQIYGAQEKYVVVELDVSSFSGSGSGSAEIADVEVNYLGMSNGQRNKVDSRVSGAFTNSESEAVASLDAKVMEDVTLQVANEVNERAVSLRDEGKVKEAEKLLRSNAGYLKGQAARLNAPALGALAEKNEADAASVASDEEWGSTRKTMRARQHNLKTQQSY